MTTKPGRISFSEAVSDLGREFLSVILVVLLLLPALAIRLTDHVTLWWVHRRGGLE